MLSYTGNLILSLILHFLGVFFGLTVWYLFPRNPLRTVVGKATERQIAVSIPSCRLEALTAEKQPLFEERERKFA